MNVIIEKLSPQNLHAFVELIKIFEDVFELDNFNQPADEHLQHLLNKTDFFVVVAKHNNKVVGGLTVYILHSYYSAKPSAYIYDVGLSPHFQRKGIGKKLISYLTRYCKENGFKDAFVEAETEDIQAVNFYRSTAFSNELQATHFTYLLEN